jgi:hypothetical protein
MAVVTTLQTAGIHPAQRISTGLKVAAGAVRAMIDSYVSHRMQTSASQAEYVSKAARTPHHVRLESSAADRHEEPPALQPLEPGTISDAIPAFFVGRNRDGLWVVRHTKGEAGGIFLFRDSATAFARRQGGAAGSAMIFPTFRFELDIANSGNPLAAQIGWSIRLARRLWQRIVAASGARQLR